MELTRIQAIEYLEIDEKAFDKVVIKKVEK